MKLQNNVLLAALGIAFAVSATGCTSYQHAKNVGMVGYSENVTKAESIGPQRGADCTWSVLGYALGGEPTLDKAMANARVGGGESLSDAVEGVDRGTDGVRYLTNVSTETDGFNAVIIGKHCLIVKGVGHR